jgi:riboflavin kinase/FMN adenylyltransferase
MQHFYSLEDVALKNAWLTIGSFDGVHIGHRKIIDNLIAGAHAVGAPAIVLTFYPHPALVLRGPQESFYLTTPEEKAALLGEAGIDIVVTFPFNRDVAAYTADHFMQTLHKHLDLNQLWVGYDFALGSHREGDVAKLREIGAKIGYTVKEINPFEINNTIVSSTRIRALIENSEVLAAAEFLGRPYQLTGLVERGDMRGRTIGIPTANLAVSKERVVPGAGVYACWVDIGDKRYQAVTNVGMRPTFEVAPVAPRVESHILDFDEDIYGKVISVHFLHHLRPEMKFSGVDALVAQIQLDITATRKLFKEQVQ